MIAPSSKAYVPFVSVQNMMNLTHHIGLETMLRGLAGEIEADFKRWEQFDKTPRVASHSDVGVIELMPTSDGEAYGFKYVNGHPKNTAEGLQTVTAFGLLADVYTGYPTLLSEMTLLTALRTAATSAMAAKYLAPKGATTMAMIGNGAQSEFQTLAMKAIIGLKAVRLYDIDPAATEKAARNLEGMGVHVTRVPLRRREYGRRRDHHHLHRRQTMRDNPHRQYDRRGRAYQRHRRRLPRQNRTGRSDPASL